MGEVKVVNVSTPSEMNDFVRMVRGVYSHCPQYVPDLESDVKGLFDVKTNPGLEFSDIQPFLAYRNEVPVGRIVGIVNRKANARWGIKNVRFSMIEFLDDLEVSKALIDAVTEWGRGYGMTAIHGPLGVTDFDKEGMLIENFELSGAMTSIYNHPYYPKHMEKLGFTKEVDWLQIRINIPKEVPAKYARVAQYNREMMGLRVMKFSRQEIMDEYGQKVFKVFNEAYSNIFGFSELSPTQVNRFLKQYLKVIDTRMIPFILNENDEVVGAAVTMTSLAEALKKANGRMLPLGWYHLLRALKWKHEDNAEMLLIAVRPDYQGYGVNAMFFDDLIPLYNEKGIKWAETGPQLEDNVRELTQWKPLKPEYVKRRRCFVKMIESRN